jgi:hypothetical protein
MSFLSNYTLWLKHAITILLTPLLFMCVWHNSTALTFTSVRNGLFYDPCTWANLVGCPATPPAPVIGVNVPGPNDDVVIDHTVTVNTCFQFNIKSLTINSNKTLSIAGTPTCYTRLIIAGTPGVCALVLDNSANLLIENNGIVDVAGGLCVPNSGNNLITASSGGALSGGRFTVRGCYAQGSRVVGSTMTSGGACNANPVSARVEYCISCTSCTGCQCGNGITATGDAAQTCARLLPVEWLNVTARMEKGRVLLSWATAWEIDNYKFEIQRSVDGYNFITIGEQPTVQMNSSKVNEYSYADTEVPNNKLVYYRIKQVDIDSKFSFSKTVVINKEEQMTTCKIFPNPSATGSIYIDIDGSDWLLIKYVTPQGKVVLEEQLLGDVGTTFFTPKTPLLKGLYMVVVATPSHTFVHKLQIRE